MARIKGGAYTRQRRRRVLRQVQGFRGRRKSNFTIAKEAFDKALCYAFRDRRARKRDFRRLWIARINAAARLNGVSYSRLVSGLKSAQIELDRRTLSEIAIYDPETFTAIVKETHASN